MEEFVKEPQSPQAAARMSHQEKEWLMWQRRAQAGDPIAQEWLQDTGQGNEGCTCGTCEAGDGLEISNWFLEKEHPQGKVWKCASCGSRVLGDAPCPLAEKREQARLDHPGQGKGPDNLVLKKKNA